MKKFSDLTIPEIREWCATKGMGWTYLDSVCQYSKPNEHGVHTLQSCTFTKRDYKPDEDANQLRDLVVKACCTGDGDEMESKFFKLYNLIECEVGGWGNEAAVMCAIFTHPLKVIEAIYLIVEGGK